MDEEKEEIVWLPKSMADKINELQKTDSKAYENVIIDYIDSSKREIKTNVDSLEEDVLLYKASMIKAKKAFQDAKDVEIEASYSMWEKYDKQKSDIRKKAGNLIDELQPLKKELNEINNIIKSINTFEIEKLIDMIKFFNSNVYGETENVLKFLIEKYKK